MPKLFVPTPNVVEVTFEHRTTETITACHVLHLLNNNPPTTEAQVNDLCFNLSGYYAQQIAPFLSHEWQYDTLTCTPIDSAGLFTTIDHSHIVLGGIAAPALPNNCAARLELLTGLPGRSFRGRKKVGGIPENKVSGNRIDPLWLESVRSGWQGLGFFVLGLSWTWVLLSKVAGHIVRTEGLVTPITDVLIRDNAMGSCRSRVHHTPA